jgi:hypothetical protein
MDSHISKGNKKRTKQVTEKSFIFSKSTYNLVGHLWGNGGNFLTNFKCSEGLRPMIINLGLEVPPQETNARGQIR